LLVIRTIDPLNNAIIAENDYRVLQPWRITDPNGNRTQVAFDILGMVAGTAVMGKDGEDKRDSLEGFNADLTPEQIDDFFNAGDPHDFAPALLGNATSRIIYDLDRFRNTREANPDDPAKWQPACAATLARETHFHDPLPPGGLKIQISFGYSDGFGREIQKKIQAEPETSGGPPRWVGSGWTIFNNKGKPVRQYEPFFSATHGFEFANMVGVSPVLFYDPVERVIATLLPNDAYEKVVFDPWRQETWDVNDTVLLDPRTDADVQGFTEKYFSAVDNPPGTWQTWYAQRGSPDPNGAEPKSPEPRAAWLAAQHANTPAIVHLDTLGRTFLTIADNGNFGQYETRVELDIEGNVLSVTDAKERKIATTTYNVLGAPIFTTSVDAGNRWILSHVLGNPLRSWDSRQHTIRTTYDALQRPTHLFVQHDADPEILAERTVFGEAHPDAAALNLRGKAYQVFDGAGAATSEAYDFKGNLLQSSRQLAKEYKQRMDWSVVANLTEVQAIANAAAPLLENETFTSSTTYDALNRPVTLTTPDQSVIRPMYNEANLLERVEVNLRGTSNNIRK
jgi:YD repeat-containing protein